MVGGQGQGLTLPLPQMLHRRRRVGTSPTRVNKRNRVSPLCSLWVGRSQDPPMAQRVQDAGGSEGGAVIASIRVQNLPGVQTSRLPAGVSSRGNRRNNFQMGKQMMAGITCWCAHHRRNSWRFAWLYSLALALRSKFMGGRKHTQPGLWS